MVLRGRFVGRLCALDAEVLPVSAPHLYKHTHCCATACAERQKLSAPVGFNKHNHHRPEARLSLKTTLGPRSTQRNQEEEEETG